MTRPLLDQLLTALTAGLRVQADGDRLTITGPPGGSRRQLNPLARPLLTRKAEVLGMVAFLTGAAEVLDWQTAPTGVRDTPCRLCGHPTLTRDPYDGRAVHKTCAEAALRAAANTPQGGQDRWGRPDDQRAAQQRAWAADLGRAAP